MVSHVDASVGPDAGLGTGPAGVLLGRWDGDVVLMQSMKKPMTLCSSWERLQCLAATDQIVVGGGQAKKKNYIKGTTCRKDGYPLVESKAS
jgi:hypothetical protein